MIITMSRRMVAEEMVGMIFREQMKKLINQNKEDEKTNN